MKKPEIKPRGISVRNTNFLMAILTIVISVLLLFATYKTKAGYSQLRTATDNYIQWQREAYNLQMASDYLTEQARLFTETGDRQYLDNYFEEADVTRRRDKSLEVTRSSLDNTPIYDALSAAMNESVALMEREYYAMRLTISAYGYDIAEYPQVIQAVQLSSEDAALSAGQQEVKARSMVFDSIYREKKETISSRMEECLQALADEIGSRQKTTADELQSLLDRQRLLIILTISITLFTMLLTLLLVISPLLRAVVYIRADQPLPIRGSNEFQFLAKTYNLMYEANREQKEQLAYEATHDQLTGIYNRSGYDFILKKTDWAASVLLLFDADRFKQINDTYGHEMGDRVLKRVAETIKKAFRSQDYVCRIGGDEFAVIMVHSQDATPELIQSKVERINKLLEQPDGDVPSICLSCGAVYGDYSNDVEKFFKRADAALYHVKSTGGADCEVCDPK